MATYKNFEENLNLIKNGHRGDRQLVLEFVRNNIVTSNYNFVDFCSINWLGDEICDDMFSGFLDIQNVYYISIALNQIAKTNVELFKCWFKYFGNATYLENDIYGLADINVLNYIREKELFLIRYENCFCTSVVYKDIAMFNYFKDKVNYKKIAQNYNLAH